MLYNTGVLIKLKRRKFSSPGIVFPFSIIHKTINMVFIK